MKKTLIYALFPCLLNQYSFTMLMPYGISFFKEISNEAKQNESALNHSNLKKAITKLKNKNLSKEDYKWTNLFFRASSIPNLMQQMLEDGQNPNVQEITTLNTVLHEKAWIGDLESVQLLLNFQALPNLQNSVGNTPLMEAVRKNEIDEEIRRAIVMELLKAGADNGIKNNKQQKASDIAKINNLKKIARMIENYHGPTLKNLCIEFINDNRHFFSSKDWFKLPTSLEELFRICDNCEAENSSLNTLLRCGRCKDTYYCNRTCQKQAWPKHRAKCIEKTKGQ